MASRAFLRCSPMIRLSTDSAGIYHFIQTRKIAPG